MARKLKVAMHQLDYTSGDFAGNFGKTSASVKSVEADIHVLPECAVTNYACDDLFLDTSFQREVVAWNERYRALSGDLGVTLVVGTPLRGRANSRRMGNGFVVYRNGREVHSGFKTHMPNYDVFDDVRWFESRLEQTGKDAELGVLEVATDGGVATLGFCICEDIWFSDVTDELKRLGAEIIVSLNSSPFAIAKDAFRRNSVFKQRVAETGVPLVYVNQVGGNDELVWDGCSAVVDPDGVLYEMDAWKEGCDVVTLVDEGRGFRNAVAKAPIVLADPQERYLAAGVGLKAYLVKNGFAGVTFGLSGGADSTAVAALVADILGPEWIDCAMMPSPHSSKGSITRAEQFAAGVGTGFRAVEHKITAQYEAHREGFRIATGKDPEGLADENLQAQIRGNILSLISNTHGGRYAVLGTSNKSELLMGYGTLYGDLRGAYNPLKDLYKSIDVFPILKMRHAVAVDPDPEFARLWRQTFGKDLEVYKPVAVGALQAVIDEPPSAELRPGQKDTDSLPEYPRLDGVLWHLEDAKESLTDGEIAEICGETVEFVSAIRRKVQVMEFKRNQGAPGPKIHRKSPTRKDRRFPMTCRFP